MDKKDKTYEIWWDKDEKVVRARATGVLDVDEAQGILEATEKIAQDHKDSINWLIDLNQMTKVTSQARKILAEASGHPSIHRYAFVGASIFIRTVANFIAAAGGQKKSRHFTEEKEALEWIKGE